MSLLAPNIIERAIATLKGFTQWRIVLIGAALLIVLGAVLFTYDACGDWQSNRGIGKAKQEVNAALSDVNAAKAVLDPVQEAVAIEKVRAATQQAVNASTATDEAKTATNQALANYAATVQANRPTGTSADDLRRKLEELGQ